MYFCGYVPALVTLKLIHTINLSNYAVKMTDLWLKRTQLSYCGSFMRPTINEKTSRDQSLNRQCICMIGSGGFDFMIVILTGAHCANNSLCKLQRIASALMAVSFVCDNGLRQCQTCKKSGSNCLQTFYE